jgi:acyl-CoA thioesterase-1
MPQVLKGKHRIVTLGDSITEFGGRPGGYVWLLKRYLDALYPAQKSKIINAGISGNKSTDMQVRFQQDVLDKKPDLITVNVGVNDVWHTFYDFQAQKAHPNGDLPTGVSLPLYREKLTAMVKAAHSVEIPVVLLSPTLIYENLDGAENLRLIQYVASMREIASQNNCLFIDLNTPFRDVIATYQKHAGQTQNLLTRDGVHLNAVGNQIMAYTILIGLGVPENELQNLRLENPPSGLAGWFRHIKRQ